MGTELWSAIFLEAAHGLLCPDAPRDERIMPLVWKWLLAEEQPFFDMLRRANAVRPYRGRR